MFSFCYIFLFSYYLILICVITFLFSLKKYLHFNDSNFLLHEDFYCNNFTSYSGGKIRLSICMQDRAKPALGHDKTILCLADIR